MIRSLLHPRARGARVLRLLLATLALVGSQGAFVGAAFPRALHAATAASWASGSSSQGQPSVDPARLPVRHGRRVAQRVGPSDANGAVPPASPVVIRPAGPAAAFVLPASFVPPPPFHPPRAR